MTQRICPSESSWRSRLVVMTSTASKDSLIEPSWQGREPLGHLRGAGPLRTGTFTFAGHPMWCEREGSGIGRDSCDGSVDRRDGVEGVAAERLRQNLPHRQETLGGLQLSLGSSVLPQQLSTAPAGHEGRAVLVD